jgi:hypothetical protein
MEVSMIQMRRLLVCACLSVPAWAQTDRLDVEEEGGRFRVVMAPSGTVLRETGDRPGDAVLRAVPGSPALAATWLETDADGRRVPFWSVSLDGRVFQPARATSYDLLLRAGRFDPLANAPPAVPSHLEAGSGTRLWVVQYWTQALEPYHEALRVRGAELRLFLPWHANVVAMDAAAAADVATLPFVRWVGSFQPAWRLEEELLAGQRSAALDGPERQVHLLTLRRGEDGHRPVLDRIRLLGGRIDSDSPETHLVGATLRPWQIADLARSDDVQWIDRAGPPGQDLDLARSFHGTNYLETATGYTGQGVRVEVMDGGCDLTHPDLQNRLVHTTSPTDAHGTCTSGIVLGTGGGNAAARGIMPAAFLVIGNYNGFAGGSRYNHTAELQNPALPYQTVLQSNSWGNPQVTSYNSISQNMDLILFDHQRISICQSQSNLGNQSSRPEAWAKNVISVGGIRHFNTLSKSDDSWSGGASIGPAADGRIKPDVASFYDAILCTDVVGAGGYASGNYYSSFGGTSGATPIVAGHLGLLYQMWSDRVFGNAAPGATVFENRPYNTTAKALLINTATQWTFSGTAHDLTRTHQGWGHPDLRTAYDLRNALYIVDESDVLAPFGTTTHTLSVAPGTPALKATMVYRDRPGTTSSTLHRINNLDLKLTAPSATVWWGNQGLGAGLWSTPGGGPNNVDTVENVFVQNPEPGTWLVQVIAAEVNQDAHVETPALDADYALVVSGVSMTPPSPPADPSGLVATAITSSRIDLAWTDNSTNETGFKIERSLDGVNFNQVATVGANVTTWPDTGLPPSTTHHYRVRATNGAGDSGYSNVANATTLPASPVDQTATGETAVAGSVTGSYLNTRVNDGVYESIQERLSGGPSRNRYSWLEHRWTFSVQPGSAVSFHLKAYHGANSEGDHFTFAWSSDGVNFTSLVTVTRTVDDGTYQTAALPATISGTVTIRVQDTVRTPGTRNRDSVFVDHMFIRTTP